MPDYESSMNLICEREPFQRRGSSQWDCILILNLRPRKEAHEADMAGEKRNIETLSLSGAVCAIQT